jgi:hypothetical protein
LLLALSMAASPVPTATPAPVPLTLAGVTLGETAAQLIADRGEPLLVQHAPEGDLWMYFSPGGGSLEAVVIKKGYVTVVSLLGHKTEPPALPEDVGVLGVHLGGPASQIPEAARDAKPIVVNGAKYTFRVTDDGASVLSINAELPAETAGTLPAATMPALHDGSSESQAVVLHAANRQLGTLYENGYMESHDFCLPESKWRLLSQSVLHDGAKSYDVWDVGCMSGTLTNRIYFDVTNFTATMPLPTPSPTSSPKVPLR